VLTTIFIEKPSADTSANRASHGSIDSYSSDESASSVPQHVGRLALERPSTNNQSFPTYTTNLNASQAYIASDIDVTQHPVAPSYAANVDPALFHSDYRTTASSPSGQRPSTTIQPSYSTMSQRDPAAQSSNTPWEETLIARPPIPSNFAYCNPPTTNPANQLDYTLSLGTLYNSGNNHGIHYDISPYSSPSSEQGTLYSPSTGSSHMGETRQQGNWSEQSPA
jgi:hypothetical protein